MCSICSQSINKYNMRQVKNKREKKVDVGMETVPYVPEVTNLEKQEYLSKQKQSFKYSLLQDQRATNLIENITENLFGQINEGQLTVELNKHPKLSPRKDEDSKAKTHHPKRLKTNPDPVDMQQHKMLVRKFINQNKRLKKNLEMRSVQILEKIKQEEKEDIKRKIQQRSRTLEIRRLTIEKRLQQKQVRMREIRHMSVSSKEKINHIRRKKFLYEEKEQEYLQKVNQTEQDRIKRVLNEQKEKMRPMNMKQIFQHQKIHDKKMAEHDLNRSIENQKIIQQRLSYSPPTFVPKAYLMASEDQDQKKQQQNRRSRAYFINQIKKKKFLEALQQIKKAQRQFSLSKSKSPRKKQQEKEEETVKPKKSSELRQMGNNYLKEALAKVKNSNIKKNIPAFNEDALYRKRQVKSQYELQIIREERIQQVEKIRFRRIDEILRSNNTQHDKIEKLRYEAKKLDKIALDKLQTVSKRNTGDIQDLLDLNEGASLMMSSIQAKLAILSMTEPKTEPRVSTEQ